MPGDRPVRHPHECVRTSALLGYSEISYNYFTKLFAVNFPHVSIPKFKRFSKCSTCTYYSVKEAQETDAAVLEDISVCKMQHRVVFTTEKKKYYDHRLKSRTSGRHLCIMFDGMDQSKTILPWFFRLPGSASQLLRLKTHLVGFLMHEPVMRAKVFVCTDIWPHDSNLTIETIMRALTAAAKPLPPVLYVQSDNCWRENKSQIVFSFLAWLVREGVFRKVKITDI